MNGARPGDWVCPGCKKVGRHLGLKLLQRTTDYLSAVLYSCVSRITSPGGAAVSAALLQHQEELGGERGERRQEELDGETGEEEELPSSLGTGPVAAVTR